MLPDAETDLQQLAILAIVVRFWSLSNLTIMSIVHLLSTCTYDYLQQWSLKLSVANCLTVLMHHMMNWIATGRSGIQIINQRL